MTNTYCYDEAAKRKCAAKAKKQLCAVAALLNLKPTNYDLRYNAGGIAVWGETTLHTDNLYIQLECNTATTYIMIRTCKGRQDYTGGPNHFLSDATSEEIANFASRLIKN